MAANHNSYKPPLLLDQPLTLLLLCPCSCSSPCPLPWPPGLSSPSTFSPLATTHPSLSTARPSCSSLGRMLTVFV